VCPDDTTPSTVDRSDDPNFTNTDNTPGPNDQGDTNPTPGDPTDSSVEAFDKPSKEIPSNPDGPNYTVTIDTPDDEENIPMEITLDELENVERILVYPDDEQPEIVVSN